MISWFLKLFKPKILSKQICVTSVNVAPDWIEKQEWRSWSAPLDLVRGESYRQKVLQQFAGKPRKNGYLIPVSVTLTREPSNKYDANAIKVEIAGQHVGYIAKEFAADLAFLMDATQIQSFSVPGIIRGGNYRTPSLGVHIWIDKRLSPAPFISLDKNTVAKYQVPWPPYEEEGALEEINTDIYENIGFPPRGKTEKPEYYLGKHYTEYVETVKELKRAGKFEEVEQLLFNLIDAVEAESKTEKLGVAPWYYEQLAIIYRKQKALEKELKVLERFAKQQIGPGVASQKLLERLQKVRTMLAADKKHGDS